MYSYITYMHNNINLVLNILKSSLFLCNKLLTSRCSENFNFISDLHIYYSTLAFLDSEQSQFEQNQYSISESLQRKLTQTNGICKS